ncbi:hypothetical protein DFH08DRAFT_953751 [Mycena albidolilacea]|uniref:Secreted protein n=1 Tax=Mycena albidolilacea TaxID=1033008 RepID=A0AAD7EX89_9AGAR|nr:hypothetical protein DFH08DRAFT_953751 [Mycena albidolilacea]
MRTPIYIVLLVLAGHAFGAPSLEQMLGFLKQFGRDISYPANIEAAKSINYTGFSEGRHIVGRVDVTGTFIGRELNTEYIFGLFSGLATGASTSTPLVGIPLNQTIIDLVIENNLMIVTTRRDFNFTVAVVPTVWQVKFLFNDEGIVTQYDAIVYRASALFANIWPRLRKHLIKELGLPHHTSQTMAIKIRAARDICSQHEEYCLGPNKQFESKEACMRFVLHKIPLGEIWQAGQNTTLCRYIHTPMLPLRPAVHCPHVGPTGGDMCFDHSYETLLENPFPEPFAALPNNLTLAGLAGQL